MSSLNKNFNHLSCSLKDEVMVSKKEGIVSILGSDCERTKSLRRTLSADMSSNKWLPQNGFSSPLKKIDSSQEFPVSIIADSEGEDEYEKETETQGQFEIWSSILTQKAQQDTENLPPYIHPLVKSAASYLSEKSLEICTESLGSETGSDEFSSYSPSETGDAEEDKEEEEEEEEEERVAQNYDVEDCRIAKYNLAAATKKSPPKPFPPPLPSLSRRDRASVHMRPRRDNGRLVLEAVSVSSQNNFKAKRQDGRLVLSFINSPNQEKEEEGIRREEKNQMEMFEVEIENSEDEEEAEEGGIETEEEEEVDERGAGGGGGGEEVRFMMEQTPKLPSGVINVHRLALMMNKPMVLANRNQTWSNKINEMVEEEMEEVVNPINPMTQSLPPVPRMIPMPPVTTAAAATAKAATATSFNAYEYYWKPKSMATAAAAAAECPSPITQKPSLIRSKDDNNKSILSKNLMVNEKRQELLILRGNKGDCLIHLSKGCKEPRRSLLFWEPYCIATS